MAFFNKKSKDVNNTYKSPIDHHCNILFPEPTQYEIYLAKRMTYNCIQFSEKISSFDIFQNNTLNQDCISIAFAKVFYHHALGDSAIAHNLFYGYFQQLYITKYKESLDNVLLRLRLIRNNEELFLTAYYDYFEEENGDFSYVMEKFYKLTKSQTNSNGEKLLSEDISEQIFKQIAGQLLEAIEL